MSERLAAARREKETASRELAAARYELEVAEGQRRSAEDAVLKLQGGWSYRTIDGQHLRQLLRQAGAEVDA